jgi:hypothetical protein
VVSASLLIEPEEAGVELLGDPRQIRISSKQWSLRQVLDDLRDGVIELPPERDSAPGWDDLRRARLIESVLLAIPLPAFYVSSDPVVGMQVVDGVKRLSAVAAFASDRLVLSGLEYLRELEGKKWGELEAGLKRRFISTQLQIHVVEAETPSEVKLNIFKRLHTGAEPLSAQEIRHAISRTRSREFLKQLASSAAFREATGGVLAEDPRMVARELALRFVALMLDSGGLAPAVSLDAFLVRATERLDDPDAVTDAQLEELAAKFEHAMLTARALFGAGAFRRVSGGPLNRGLIDSWAVALAELPAGRADEVREKVLAVTGSPEFQGVLSGSSAEQVQRRLALARAAVSST